MAITGCLLFEPVNGPAFVEWDLYRITTTSRNSGPLINFCARPRYVQRATKAAISFRLKIEILGMSGLGVPWGYEYRLCCNNFGACPQWSEHGRGTTISLPLSDAQKQFQDETSLTQGWRMDSLYHVYNPDNVLGGGRYYYSEATRRNIAPFRNGFSFVHGGDQHHFHFLNTSDFRRHQPFDITLWPYYDHSGDDATWDSDPPWMNFAAHLAPGQPTRFFAINGNIGENLVSKITDDFLPPVPRVGDEPRTVKVRITFDSGRFLHASSNEQQVAMQICNLWVGAEDLIGEQRQDWGRFLFKREDHQPQDAGSGFISGTRPFLYTGVSSTDLINRATGAPPSASSNVTLMSLAIEPRTNFVVSPRDMDPSCAGASSIAFLRFGSERPAILSNNLYEPSHNPAAYYSWSARPLRQPWTGGKSITLPLGPGDYSKLLLHMCFGAWAFVLFNFFADNQERQLSIWVRPRSISRGDGYWDLGGDLGGSKAYHISVDCFDPRVDPHSVRSFTDTRMYKSWNYYLEPGMVFYHDFADEEKCYWGKHHTITPPNVITRKYHARGWYGYSNSNFWNDFVVRGRNTVTFISRPLLYDDGEEYDDVVPSPNKLQRNLDGYGHIHVLAADAMRPGAIDWGNYTNFDQHYAIRATNFIVPRAPDDIRGRFIAQGSDAFPVLWCPNDNGLGLFSNSASLGYGSLAIGTPVLPERTALSTTHTPALFLRGKPADSPYPMPPLDPIVYNEPAGTPTGD